MLSTIKDMINNKEEMLESAATIYEDIIDDVENYITEDSEIDDLTDDDDDRVEDNKPEDEEDDKKKDKDKDDDHEGDEMGDGVTPESLDTPVIKHSNEEIGNSSIDNLDDLDLNDPVGIIDEPEGNLNATNLDNLDNMLLDQDLGDITNVELNVSTNNLADVLPVPPMNATDAVVSDTMDTITDDGFDNEPITSNTMESVDDGFDDFELFSEAITIDANADDKPEDEKPADDNAENNVTSAVLDKVNDVNTEIEPDKDSKDKLLDKLDKLNRGILDLKENIKKQLS